MPKRWVDLILHLDEQERKTRAGSPVAAEPGVVEVEFAVSRQEMLRELTRTEEPTKEARALLEDLRQQVARAVAERD